MERITGDQPNDQKDNYQEENCQIENEINCTPSKSFIKLDFSSCNQILITPSSKRILQKQYSPTQSSPSSCKIMTEQKNNSEDTKESQFSLSTCKNINRNQLKIGDINSFCNLNNIPENIFLINTAPLLNNTSSDKKSHLSFNSFLSTTNITPIKKYSEQKSIGNFEFLNTKQLNEISIEEISIDSQNIDENQIDNELKVSEYNEYIDTECSCQNSQCQKKYCSCYLNNNYCIPSKCKCRSCFNKPEQQQEDRNNKKTIQSIQLQSDTHHHSSSSNRRRMIKMNNISSSNNKSSKEILDNSFQDSSSPNQRKDNPFRDKLISSLKESFYKLKESEISNDQSFIENELFDKQFDKQFIDQDSSSNGQIMTDDNSIENKYTKNISQNSYLHQLPEANPIRDNAQKNKLIKFEHTKSLFTLYPDLHSISLGKVSSMEPLQINKDKEIISNFNIKSLNNQPNLILEKKEQVKNYSYEFQQNEENYLIQNDVQQSNTLNQLNSRKEEIILKSYDNNNKFNKFKVKLIYKKQNQHMLVNLQSANLVIKESNFSESFIKDQNKEVQEQYEDQISSNTLIYSREIQDKNRTQQIQENINIINMSRYQINNDINLIKNDNSIFNKSTNDLSRNNQNLQFDSSFESGNLAQAFILCEGRYNLFVQQDINTNGYTQWFYFKVINQTKQSNVHFTIGNFYKKHSLFEEGMKISVLSKKNLDKQGIGWIKGGYNINYSQQILVEENGTEQNKQLKIELIKNDINRQQNGKNQYKLQFQYDFNNDNDETYFAYSIPYTYSQLQIYLRNLVNKNYPYFFVRQLCNSILGNQLYLITITNPILDSNHQKQGIFITARVHPGETVASYAVQGLIDFLLSDCEDAHELREQFVFKIIPMLNPDGVIQGNYRCSLAGCDLNRRWKAPIQYIHPEIYYSKRAIYEFNENHPILFYCDFHGHSRKKDSFLYGCESQSDFYKVREFPFILSKLNKYFNFKSCSYSIQKGRDGTSRQTLFRDLGIENIFTLETSFCGPSNPYVHFSIDDFKSIGQSLCKAIYVKFSKQKENLLKRENISLDQMKDIVIFKNSEDDDIIDGSDSEPSCDNLDEKELNSLLPTNEEIQNANDKKKKKKRKNFTQNRMVLTNYFSKSPIKEKKEVENTEKKSLIGRMTQSAFRKQPQVIKTQETEILNDSSPKIYNFICSSQKKTPTKNQYSTVSPTIFTQINYNRQQSFIHNLAQQKFVNNKSNQVYYQNEHYQQQKDYYLQQSQIQNQQFQIQQKSKQLEKQQQIFLSDQQRRSENIMKSEQKSNQDLDGQYRTYLDEFGITKTTEDENKQKSDSKRSQTPQPQKYLIKSKTRVDSLLHRCNTNYTLPDSDNKSNNQQNINTAVNPLFSQNNNEGDIPKRRQRSMNNSIVQQKTNNYNIYQVGNNNSAIQQQNLIHYPIQQQRNNYSNENNNNNNNIFKYSILEQQMIDYERKLKNGNQENRYKQNSSQIKQDRDQQYLNVKSPNMVGRDQLQKQYSINAKDNTQIQQNLKIQGINTLQTEDNDNDESSQDINNNKKQIIYQKSNSYINENYKNPTYSNVKKRIIQQVSQEMNQNQIIQKYNQQNNFHPSQQKKVQQQDVEIYFQARNSSQGNPGINQSIRKTNNKAFIEEQKNSSRFNENQVYNRKAISQQRGEITQQKLQNNNQNQTVNQLIQKLKLQNKDRILSLFKYQQQDQMQQMIDNVQQSKDIFNHTTNNFNSFKQNQVNNNSLHFQQHQNQTSKSPNQNQRIISSKTKNINSLTKQQNNQTQFQIPNKNYNQEDDKDYINQYNFLKNYTEQIYNRRRSSSAASQSYKLQNDEI